MTDLHQTIRRSRALLIIVDVHKNYLAENLTDYCLYICMYIYIYIYIYTYIYMNIVHTNKYNKKLQPPGAFNIQETPGYKQKEHVKK